MLKKKIASIFLITNIFLLSGCARDLSNDVYTSDATMSLTMQGKILSVRPVTIKDQDKMGDNTGGMLAGGALGAAAGTGVGKGSGRTVGVVGSAIAGGLLGAATEGSLSKSKGYEYIVKVDTKKLSNDDYYEGSATMRSAVASAKTSGLITIVQGDKNPFPEGLSVYVIVSEKRARIIPAS